MNTNMSMDMEMDIYMDKDTDTDTDSEKTDMTEKVPLNSCLETSKLYFKYAENIEN